MIKTATAILAFYLLLLSLIPCGDTGGGMATLLHHLFNTENTITHDHDHSNTCEDDYCSPLCGCNCCSIVLDFPTTQFIQLKSQSPLVTTAPSCDNNTWISSYPDNIWQPPRNS